MKLYRLAWASGAVVGLAGLGMLLAYAMGAHLHLPFPPPWSCVAFLAVGCALCLFQNADTRVRAGALASSAVTLGIGLLTLSETVFGANFGIDTLLFPQLLLRSVAHPGRPASLTALQFILLGLGLLLVPVAHRYGVQIREFSAITVLTLCYFSVVGGLVGTPTRASETMSPLAAILAILGAGGMLFSGRSGRLIEFFHDPGPAGMITRRLMPVPLLLPVATTLLRLAFQQAGIDMGRPGAAVFASLNILAAIAILWICSNQVFRSDQLRRHAEEEVRRSRDDLDLRVHERTRELVDANQQLAVEVVSRKSAQAELQQTNAMLNSLIEACPLAICALNLDGSLRKANAAAESLNLPHNQECRQIAERACRGESVAGTELTLTLGEKQLHLEVWASPILAPDAMLDGVVLMAADVSERKALESRIQQAQRLESLGVLAGGIAHDFNNLLTGVMGNASLLKDSFPPDSPAAASARSLLEAGESMANLTAQMLAYSGRGRFVIEPLDLSHQVSRITSLIQASIPKNVHLRLSLAEHLPLIDADASQLQQVIMNLVINAAEAIGSAQGTVEVETFARPYQAEDFKASVTRDSVAAGVYVALVVHDTGSGMDEGTRARIFDPFFTTKFAGRGLGLSAVLGIIRGHRGALTVDTRAGAGTTFRAFFPISEHQAAKVTAHQDAASPGRGTVIVVDDEEVVRRTAQAVLTRAGYDVVTANDGLAALAAYQQMPDRIEAVLLDMTMPVMGGEETLARILANWPQAVVIVSSGYDEQEARRRLGRGVAGFIQKPYTAAQLTAKISQAVSGAQAANGSAC